MRQADAVRLRLEREAVLGSHSFHANSAVQPLRAVVGDDEHKRLLVGVLEQPGDEPVDVAVVVENGRLEGVAGLVLAVLGVHELPEAVVDAVVAHLHHREQLPRPRREQVLGEPEAPVGHLVELLEQPRLVLRAEVLHVEQVLADDVGDLVLEAGRVRVRALDRRREEARPSAPRNGRGRYVPGTPTTIDEPPARPTMSQSLGALIALPSAMNRPSYVWSERLRKP